MLGAHACALQRALIHSQLGFGWLSGFQCEVILEGRFVVLGGEWLSVCTWGVHLSALEWLAYGFSGSRIVRTLLDMGLMWRRSSSWEGWECRVLNATVALAFMGCIYSASV